MLRSDGFQRKTGEQIIEIGQLLIRIKQSLPHGLFGQWLEAAFGWSDRTAQKFMQVAETFGKTAHSAVLPPSALYALASPSTPEPIRAEFIERAAAGERVTHAAVKARLAERCESLHTVQPEFITANSTSVTGTT
jgi:hypothetical protein